jgi:hypothetical protein
MPALLGYVAFEGEWWNFHRALGLRLERPHNQFLALVGFVPTYYTVCLTPVSLPVSPLSYCLLVSPAYYTKHYYKP